MEGAVECVAPPSGRRCFLFESVEVTARSQPTSWNALLEQKASDPILKSQSPNIEILKPQKPKPQTLQAGRRRLTLDKQAAEGGLKGEIDELKERLALEV